MSRNKAPFPHPGDFVAPAAPDQGPSDGSPLVYVKQWMRHSHALVFRLSNRCFQVSFFDGADILLSSEAKLVTYTDPRGFALKRVFLLLGRPGSLGFRYIQAVP